MAQALTSTCFLPDKKMTRPLELPRRVLFAMLVATVFSSLPWGGTVGLGDGVDWLSGASRERRLDESIGVAWDGAPLRATLANLAQTQHVAIWLDRRIDPGREITLAADGMTLRAVLGEIARRESLGVGEFGSALVYLGPPGALARTRAAAARGRAEAVRLPASQARKFRQTESMQWADFAEPRRLVFELAEAAGIELVDVERIPHDLWPAAELPALSLVDRLSLILGQFDLTFELAQGGRMLRIVPLPDDKTLLGTGQPPAETWTDAGSPAPGPDVSDPDRLRIERFVVQQQPLGAILRQLAAKLHLELHLDEDSIGRAGKSLETRVSCRVEKATVDELFEAILAPEGLAFRRQGTTIEVFAPQ